MEITYIIYIFMVLPMTYKSNGINGLNIRAFKIKQNVKKTSFLNSH